MCERLSNSIPKKLYKRIPSCLWGRQRFQGKVKVKLLSCVPFFATPWTVAYQASPSMGSKGEHKKKVSKKMNELTSLKKNFWDFPGGPVVKNLPHNAGDANSIPGRRTKVPHAVEQLSPSTTSRESVSCNDPARCSEHPECCHSTKTRHSQINEQTSKIVKKKKEFLLRKEISHRMGKDTYNIFIS